MSFLAILGVLAFLVIGSAIYLYFTNNLTEKYKDKDELCMGGMCFSHDRVQDMIDTMDDNTKQELRKMLH